MMRVSSRAVCWAIDSTFLMRSMNSWLWPDISAISDKRPQVKGKGRDRLTGFVVQVPGDPPAFLVFSNKAVARQLLVRLASLFQLLVDLRPFDSDPHLFPDGVEHEHVVAAEAAGHAAGHVDRPEYPMTGAERNACEGSHILRGDLRPGETVLDGVGGKCDIVEQDGPSGVNHPPYDPFPYRKGRFLHDLPRKAVGDAVAERLGIFVKQENASNGSVQKIEHAVEPHSENCVQVR